MLVGNKADRSTEREVSAQEGRALANELGCLFTETSAKTCQNVELAFYEVVRQIRRQREGEKEQLTGKKNGKTKQKGGKSGKSCTIIWVGCQQRRVLLREVTVWSYVFLWVISYCNICMGKVFCLSFFFMKISVGFSAKGGFLFGQGMNDYDREWISAFQR